MLIESFKAMAVDKGKQLAIIAGRLANIACVAPLVGGLSVYLSHPHADFLSGRFLDGRWDIEDVVARKEEIVKNDWLKIAIGGY